MTPRMATEPQATCLGVRHVDETPGLGLRCRATWNAWLLVALLFSALLVTRWETLADPPSPDQAGLWREADFLLNSGFDYRALHGAPHGDEGGPRIYVTSVLPTIAALLMWALGSPTAAHVVYRLAMFLCAALVAQQVVRLARQDMPCSSALMTGLAAFTAPLILTQAELLGMELPSVLCALLAAAALRADRYTAAVLWSFAAFCCKGSAIVVVVATLGYLVLLEAVDRVALHETPHRIARRRAVVFAAAVLFVEAIALAWGNILDDRLMVAVPLFPIVLLMSPDLATLAVVTLLGATYAKLRRSPQRRFRSPPTADEGRPMRHNAWRASLFHWLVIVLIAAAATRVTYHPRYLLLAVPFLYLEFSRTMRMYLPDRALFALLVGVVLMNVLNREGRLFPPLPPPLDRVHAYLERSREYRRALLTDVAIMRVLNETSEEAPVFATEAAYLHATVPSLGYVEGPIEGYTVFSQPLNPRFRNIRDILVERPRELTIVAWPRTFEVDEGFAFPGPSDTDEVLLRDEDGTPLVYRRRFPPEAGVEQYERFLAEQLRNDEPGLRAAERFAQEGHPGVLEHYLLLNVRPARGAAGVRTGP